MPESAATTANRPFAKIEFPAAELEALRARIDGEAVFLMIDTSSIAIAHLWIGPVINVGWECCIGCSTRTSNCPWHSDRWFMLV